MTLDVSLEAIEAELAIASRGGQVATIALARAQVLATLLAAQPAEHQGRHEAPAPYGVLAGAGADIEVANGAGVDVFTVPKAASWDDRVTAAAILLGIPVAYLEAAVKPLTDLPAAIDAPTEEDARAGEPEEEPPVVEDDVDADFFAEAKKARRKK